MHDNRTHYHLAYLTANERTGFVLDYLHFCNMAQLSPGVPNVDITIVISRTRPISVLDDLALDRLVRRAEASPWLRVRSVIWKGNVGRDFSSAGVGLKGIAQVARDTDFVMVRNRSAYGPLEESWYRRYIDQYRRHSDTGLVGSTINLAGHPSRSSAEDPRHVQTYVYLSQWRHLAPLVEDFPGNTCSDRLDVIAQGEIGLSRRIMSGGLRISCLYWPQQVFSTSSANDPTLSIRDIKEEAIDLPFRYKFRNYVITPRAIIRRLGWLLSLVTTAVSARLVLQEAISNSRVCRQYIHDYD